MHQRVMAGLSLAVLFTSVSASALAQSSRVAPDAEVRLEEVVVQARRTEENQQSVPIAVSTVSAEDLRTATVSSVSDIQRLVPALQITPTNTGTTNYTIRGSFGGQFADPGVITYVDEVPLDARVLTYQLYDLGSVQQLKGAQGTLFGKNSTGGAVLFFSRKPSSEFGGYLQARYGRLDETRFEGALNVPVTDTLRFRVSGQRETRDGTVASVTVPGLDYNNRDNASARLIVDWDPVDWINNVTQATYYRVDQRATPNLITSVAGPCTGPTTPAFSCLFQPPFNAFLGTPNILPYLAQQRTLGRRQTVNDFPYPDEVDFDAVTNTTTLTFGDIGVKNIIHASRTKQRFGRDYDGTPAPIFSTIISSDTDYVYDELQLYGVALDGRLDWRVGATYSVSEGDEVFDTVSFQTPVSPNSPAQTVNDNKATSKALFGQASYDLSALLDGLTITAGYRHTWDERETDLTRFQGQPIRVCGNQSGGVFFPGTDPATCVRSLSNEFDDSNYNFTLDWQATEDLLVYASHRKGYKAGGFNVSAPSPSQTAYAPEVVKDLEAGLKADWRLGSGQLRTNMAVFRSEYENIQSSFLVRDPITGQPSQVILNADPATGQSNTATFTGYEIEAVLAPVQWLDVSAFYSNVSARYDQFINNGANFAGQNVAGVIPYTYGFSVNIRPTLPEAWGEGRFGLTAYSSAAPLLNAASTSVTPNREQVDIRFDLNNVADSGVDIGVYGRNITAERACAPVNLGLGAPYELCSAEPLEYGVELRYRFGGER